MRIRMFIFLILIMSGCVDSTINNTDATSSSDNTTDTEKTSNPLSERLTAKTDVVISENCHGYYEYLPVNYGKDIPEGGYPLLIFIHGVGESGIGNANELEKVLVNSTFPKIITAGKFPDKHKFVVLMPQYFSGPVDDTLGYHFGIFPDQIDELFDFAETNYTINPKRIYMTGVSMGGARCLTYAGTKPEYAARIAAIVPLASYINESYPTHAIDDTEAAVIAASNLPIWAIHNSTDPIALPSWIENIQNKLLAISPTMTPAPILEMRTPDVLMHEQFTPDPYDPETIGSNGLNIYDWMLQYTR